MPAEEEAPASTREPIQSRSNPTASSSSTPVGTAVKQELNVEAGEAVVPKREREVEDEGEIEIVKKMRKDKKGPGSIYKPIMVTDVNPPSISMMMRADKVGQIRRSRYSRFDRGLILGRSCR